MPSASVWLSLAPIPSAKVMLRRDAQLFTAWRPRCVDGFERRAAPVSSIPITFIAATFEQDFSTAGSASKAEAWSLMPSLAYTFKVNFGALRREIAAHVQATRTRLTHWVHIFEANGKS